MTVFSEYAQFYDTLYRDKVYEKECDFLEEIYKKYSKRKIKTILDLGCGTASHIILLKKRGYDVVGVDFSFEMLRFAKQKIENEHLNIELYNEDIQKVRLHRKFDAVISMFDVIGYQTTNESLEKTFLTVRKHVKRGGLFIFDVWFGPGVLKDRPRDREKVVNYSEGEKIVRHSECKTDVVNQIVDVRFTTKKYLRGKLVDENVELHKMRFFFLNEIKLLLNKSGLLINSICPIFRVDDSVSDVDWKIAVICEGI